MTVRPDPSKTTYTELPVVRVVGVRAPGKSRVTARERANRGAAGRRIEVLDRHLVSAVRSVQRFQLPFGVRPGVAQQRRVQRVAFALCREARRGVQLLGEVVPEHGLARVGMVLKEVDLSVTISGRSSPSNQTIGSSPWLLWSCHFQFGVRMRSPGSMSQASPSTVV